jgi:hypothetical protein
LISIQIFTIERVLEERFVREESLIKCGGERSIETLFKTFVESNGKDTSGL